MGSDIGIVRWEETEIPPCASLRLLATVLRDANFQGTVYMSQQLVTAS